MTVNSAWKPEPENNIRSYQAIPICAEPIGWSGCFFAIVFLNRRPSLPFPLRRRGNALCFVWLSFRIRH